MSTKLISSAVNERDMGNGNLIRWWLIKPTRPQTVNTQASRSNRSWSSMISSTAGSIVLLLHVVFCNAVAGTKATFPMSRAGLPATRVECVVSTLALTNCRSPGDTGRAEEEALYVLNMVDPNNNNKIIIIIITTINNNITTNQKRVSSIIHML